LSGIDSLLRSPEALWLLFAAVSAWVVLGWGRRSWRRWDAKRRRRAFDAREERRWQGHRRGSGSLGRIEKK
jgi:hypothetical protein